MRATQTQDTHLAVAVVLSWWDAVLVGLVRDALAPWAPLVCFPDPPERLCCCSRISTPRSRIRSKLILWNSGCCVSQSTLSGRICSRFVRSLSRTARIRVISAASTGALHHIHSRDKR
jgi:hypothetical protein